MAWLLDTNVWIQHLKNPGGPVEQRLNRVSPSEILICSVVKAELWHGAHKYERCERRLMALQSLETRAQVIGPNDLKIAAICRVHRLTLVTSITNEFSRITGLAVEDWTKA